MRTVSDNHAAERSLREGGPADRRDGLLLDQIGGELRGIFGPVEGEPLPDSLRALAALIDSRKQQADAA